jgi:adducin
MKCGLLPISQEAILCGNISYHDFKGILSEEDIRTLLAQDLGPINKVLNYTIIYKLFNIEKLTNSLF